jgi:hypothetical protein
MTFGLLLPRALSMSLGNVPAAGLLVLLLAPWGCGGVVASGGYPGAGGTVGIGGSPVGAGGVGVVGGVSGAGGAPAASAGGTVGIGGSPVGAGGVGVVGGVSGAGGAPAATGCSGGPFTPGARNSRYPLVDGATWTYRHIPSMAPAWDEIDSARATTYRGQPAFIFDDQEDAQGFQTHSTLVVNGTGVFRVYKEITLQVPVVTVTYNPPFLRFDEAWNRDGQSVTLGDGWTQNCTGVDPVIKCASAGTTTGTKTHVYTVVQACTPVTVPAGTFDAIKIRLADPSDATQWGVYSFALGVGMVLAETSFSPDPCSGPDLDREELVSYSIP